VSGGAGRILRGAIDALRNGRWITRERVTYCGLVFTVISVVILAAGVVSHTTNKFVADNGEQLALDFINYYAGAKAAVSGQASLVYDRVWLRAFEDAVTGPATARMYSYPPVAMLLTLPLALFSFVPALIAWVAVGAGSCFELLRRLVGWRAACFAVVGTPAAFFNVYAGQNGYFTAALLAGGLMTLERRPVIAGICVGCLAYKPQMAVLFPFAFAAGGYWRAFAAAAATAILLVLASVALFGILAWTEFLGQTSVERYFLEVEAGFSHRMPTVFAALRTLDASPSLAYGAQLVSGALALAAVLFTWRRPGTVDIKAATLVVATFLVTPHAWDYDEVVLIFTAAWLWRDGVRTGFLPWERLAILALLVLPMPSIMVNVLTGIEPGPVVLWLVLVLLVRRAVGSPAATGIAGTNTQAGNANLNAMERVRKGWCPGP
jgi:hypothetical protein